MEFLTVGLAIIHRKGNVLIGKRKEKDELVEHLTWVFPGGRLGSLDFEREIKEIVKLETGLEINVKAIVATRKTPDANLESNIILIYFDCTSSGSERAGGDLKELEWMPASSVCEYFTTSVMNEVMSFLKNIEVNKL